MRRRSILGTKQPGVLTVTSTGTTYAAINEDHYYQVCYNGSPLTNTTELYKVKISYVDYPNGGLPYWYLGYTIYSSYGGFKFRISQVYDSSKSLRVKLEYLDASVTFTIYQSKVGYLRLDGVISTDKNSTIKSYVSCQQSSSSTVSTSARPSTGETISFSSDKSWLTCSYEQSSSSSAIFVIFNSSAFNGNDIEVANVTFTIGTTSTSIKFVQMPSTYGNTVDGQPYAQMDGGLKWSIFTVGDSNISASTLFAWGETEPKDTYSWDTYKYGVYNSSASPNYGMTKYNSSDGKTVLDQSDDAAVANWGGNWRMPTYEEFQTLLNNSTTIYASIRKSSGYSEKQYVFLVGANGKVLPMITCHTSSLVTTKSSKTYNYTTQVSSWAGTDTQRYKGLPIKGVHS